MVDRKNEWQNVIMDILGKRCIFCEKIENLRLHHIKPKYLGGPDKIDNLVVLCAGCHKEMHYTKSNQSPMKSYINLEISKWHKSFWKKEKNQIHCSGKGDIWREKNVIHS